MPEITQNKLLTPVTYGNFQAYYFRRKKNREGQREKGLGRKKEERKKRIKKKEKRTQPVIQTHRNSGQAYVIEKMFRNTKAILRKKDGAGGKNSPDFNTTKLQSSRQYGTVTKIEV